MFTSAHEAFWAASRRVNGDSDGTRELIDVLLLHRSMNAGQVIAGIIAALTVGAVTVDVVAVEARRCTQDQSAGGATPGRHSTEHSHDLEQHDVQRGIQQQRVVSLTQRRLTDPAAVIAGLPADTRPVPSVAAYDQLLRRTGTSEHHTPGAVPVLQPLKVSPP